MFKFYLMLFEIKGVFTPSVNPSDQTIDNFGPKVNVKVFEEDKEVKKIKKFPVGKITVSSKHATQAKVCASKPNKKELTKKMVRIGTDNVYEYAKNVRLQNTNR